MSAVQAELARLGVFKGAHGLEGLANAADFWGALPYGTRLEYGPGIADYLHQDVLTAAIRGLQELAELRAENDRLRGLIAPQGLKVAEYARLWVLAESAKAHAKRRLSEALQALTYYGEEKPAGVKEIPGAPPLIVERYRDYDEHGYIQVTDDWVYNKWAPLFDPSLKCGAEADGDPRVEAQRVAWQLYRAAKMHAGDRRRVLTRTVNRLEAQRAKAGQS